VTGASDTLDPIATAEARIAGSKHLIAAVAQDLSQQERWLAHYRVAERRRARRAKLHALLYWLELKWQRLARSLRRLGLVSLRLAREVSVFLWHRAVALFLLLRRWTIAALAWVRPRAYALALTLAAWTLALAAWALAEVRLAARGLGRGAAIAAAWTAHHSRIVGAMVWRSLLAASVWARIEAARLAIVLHRELRRFSAWTRKKAGHFSRTSLATASLGFSWAKTEGPHPAAAHRALAIRRCTALVLFEARRARLPALRAG
jgi:hypothetical protein